MRKGQHVRKHRRTSVKHKKFTAGRNRTSFHYHQVLKEGDKWYPKGVEHKEYHLVLVDVQDGKYPNSYLILKSKKERDFYIKNVAKKLNPNQQFFTTEVFVDKKGNWIPIE